MEKLYYCEFCQGRTESFITLKNVEFNHNHKTLSILSEVRTCKVCGNQVYDRELDQITTEKAINEYNTLYGIPGSEIIKFRNNLNISQSTLSKIIGIAKKTLVSYEKNQAIPSDHYLQILKVVMEKPEIIQLFAKNSDKIFTKKEAEKIFFCDIPDSFKVCEDEYHGYNDYSEEKIEQVILYFAEHSTVMTKINKGLFYLDFSAYKEFARSITGSSYQKFAYGPFIASLYQKIEKLVFQKKIHVKSISTENLKYNEYTSLIKPNLSLFNESEIILLQKVRDYVTSLSASAVSEDSHEEKAWLMTEDGAYISYNYALSLNKDFFENK